MMTKRLIGGALALTMITAACANNDGTETGNPVPAADQQEVAAAAPEQTATPEPTGSTGDAGAATFLGSTSLGNVLIGTDGRTLYGFTNDIEAKSTCYGGCAEAWPPVLVDQDWTVGPGLDLGIFATTVRDDGQLQLVAGKWPLYYYVADGQPGDINGQGSGDVWFVVDTDGALITDVGSDSAADDSGPADATTEQAAVIDVGSTDLGQVLVDGESLTLYGFTNDTDGRPSCNSACADAWPPLVVDELPSNLDPAVFSVAERSDGSLQLVAGVWPLYRFAGDAAAGDINGQGSGGVWFAAAPDGSLVGRDGAPATETEPAAGSSDY